MVWEVSPGAAAEARPGRAAQSGIRYPVVVRFEKLNYAGVSTNNYAPNEARPALALKRMHNARGVSHCLVRGMRH